MRSKIAVIAVVDDSELELELTRRSLVAEGFEVVTYSSAIDVDHFIKRTQPDLVLLDVKMPIIDGVTICRLLKNNPSTRNYAIALYSSMGECELQEKSKDCGADGFVVKSESSEELVDQINRILGSAGSGGSGA
jgi:CheY-like chemotaxis protein